jgi:hypothetical protein
MAVQNITPAETPSSSWLVAQSMFARFPAAQGLDLCKEIIVCTPYSDIAEYQGTRAAIEAEGVIPAGTTWPVGFNDLHWEDEKFRYWLCRQRLHGVKGRRQSYLNVDWWMFRCYPVETKSLEMRAVERKAKELADEIYRQSSEGKAVWNKQWNAHWASLKDEKFQAFKALIPGINRPKRGRRAKSAEQPSR